ncbi:MAG: hypothetical protein N2483_03990 [Burkholderiaceae bacterium]|nr:hypothetical protein [Burkholderiaceae bacterium]
MMMLLELDGNAPRDQVAALKAARALLGASQSRMAELLAVSPRTYQGWEAGRPCRHWSLVATAVAYLVAALRDEQAAIAWWNT